MDHTLTYKKKAQIKKTTWRATIDNCNPVITFPSRFAGVAVQEIPRDNTVTEYRVKTIVIIFPYIALVALMISSFKSAFVLKSP